MRQVELELSWEVTPTINLAAQQNAVRVLTDVQVRNGGTSPCEGGHLTITSSPPFLRPLELPFAPLAPGATCTLETHGLRMDADVLRRLSERLRGEVNVQIHIDRTPLVTDQREVEILAPREWAGVVGLPELLAAFVLPNDPGLNDLLRVASDRVAAHTGSTGLDGYQSGSPARVRSIVRSLYEVVADRDLRYIPPPASFERTGQKVRLPDEVLSNGLGTCLDLTLLLAALLEQAGLHPMLVVVDGHALPGAWLVERSLPSPATDDVTQLRNRIRLGELVVFDSSSVATGGTWDQAVARGDGYLVGDDALHFAVDVHVARQHRILPLQLVTESTARPLARRPPAPDLAVQAAERMVSERPVAAIGDDVSPAGRLDRWKARLLDLSLRNKLVAFRDNKLSLPLAHVLGAELEDALAAGEKLAIGPRADLLGEDDPRDAASHQALTGEAAAVEYHRDQQRAGRLLSTLTPREFDKRAAELYRSNALAMGESGAVTLYLTIGMLHWYERADSQVLRKAPLLLVPVSMVRRGTGRYAIEAADDETRANVTLLKKLQDDFEARLPELDTLPTDASGVDVSAVMTAFTHLATRFPRWEVTPECTISQLQFTKFLMWLDLEAKTEHILKNAIVAHLFDGGGEAFPMKTGFPALEALDTAHPPSSIQPVMSADPSQLQAVVAALEGNSFVLQGPPGTGKSQTITNMIASLLAAGRTVLFVSEKRAALEVVHRRLTSVGLGPFCLELHSRQANKKAVLQSLAQALEAGATAAPDGWAEKAAQLETVSRQLNETAAILRRPTPFRLTTQGVLDHLIGLREVERVPVDPALLDGIDQAWLASWQEAARTLRVAMVETGPPAEHPWRQSRCAEWSPRLQRELEALLASMSEQAGELARAVRDCPSQLGLPRPPDSLDELEALGRIARLLVGSTGPPETLVKDASRAKALDVLTQVRGPLLAHTVAEQQVHAVFTEGIAELDLEAHAKKLQRWRGVFFLIAWMMLYSTRRQLRAHVRGDTALPDDGALEELVKQALARATHREAVLERDAELQRLFGEHWRGLQTPPETLDTLVEGSAAFAEALHQLTGSLDVGQAMAVRTALVPLFTSESEMVGAQTERGRKLMQLQDLIERWTESWQTLHTRVGAECPPSLAEQFEHVSAMVSNQALFRDWCYFEAAARDVDALGLSAVTDGLRDGSCSPDAFEDVVERSLLESWWENAAEREPALGRLRGADQADVMQRFHDLDDEVLDLTQQQIAATLALAIPDLDAPGSEMATLKHQLQLQRRHMPLRKLLTRIPNLIRRLKPCALMSPLSVAQFLDPELPGYDVVLFDEASQIPPWDAVGAIARGEQVVIVGDSKQLPPTSFFGSTGGDEEVDEDDRIDLDSILEEAIAAGLPEHRLAWHYRSQHESLIAFSNHQYYDGRLRTFPSASQRVPSLGVHLRKVPDGFYDRGASRTNKAEAEAIRDEVRALALRPDGDRPTVGVIAFSTAQQRLIEDLLEHERGQNPTLEVLYQGDEGLFVKNLENVQGDERDLILFSIGYGPDRQGRVSMNFGPLNKDGGERRLNVAVTRARKKVVVVSTLRADQIDLSRTRAVGVAHLKTYLAYAERGIVAIDAAASTDGDAEPESPLEVEILEALRRAGWQVHCQVGVSGYRVDLAVVDPDREGAYLVGVECDGATYHSSAVARERDRLRQQVLESLGWQIERVWSTDWWHAREATERKLLAILDAHLAASRLANARMPASPEERDPVEPLPVPAEPPASEETAETSALDRVREAMTEAADLTRHLDAPVYQEPAIGQASPDIDFYGPEGLTETARLLHQLAMDGPVEEDHAWLLLRNAWGFGRLGRKIRERFQEALTRLAAQGRVTGVEGAVWPAGTSPEAWQGFRVPGDARSFDQIPLREIANAQLWVLDRANGMPIEGDELRRTAATLLGITTYSRRVRARSEDATSLVTSMPGVASDDDALSKAVAARAEPR